MGSASGAAASGLSSISPAAAIVGGFYSGAADKAAAEGQNQADIAQADRLERAAEYGKAQAAETDAQLRENLNVTLGNIDSVRAAQHVDPSSPTTAALRDRTAYIGDRSRSIQVGNINAQAAQNESDAAYLRASGAYAVKLGGLKAITDEASGFAKAGGMIAKTASGGAGGG